MKPPSHSHSAVRLKNQPLWDLTSRLRGHSRKVTGPRQAILNVLRRHPHPLSNKEIFTALPPGECDLATVYRSLHLLRATGMVKRFDFGDGVARFELLGDGDDGHHHHLICTECAVIVEVDECFPRELEEKLAEQNGFATVTHQLEFFGVCQRCQPAAGKK